MKKSEEEEEEELIYNFHDHHPSYTEYHNHMPWESETIFVILRLREQEHLFFWP